MKKKLVYLFLVMVLVMTAIPVYGAKLNYQTGGKSKKTDTVTVYVNGKKLALTATPAFLDEGYAMIPYKSVLCNSVVGAKSTYNSKTKKLTLTYGSHKIIFTLNSKMAKVDGKNQELDVAPKEVTYTSSKKKLIVVPARFTAKAMEVGYNWNPDKKSVSITCKDQSVPTGLKLTYKGKTISYTNTTYTVTLNGKKLKLPIPGIVDSGQIMVPAEAVFKSSQVKISYPTTSTILFEKGKDVSMQIQLDTSNAYVNGVKKTMPANAFTVKSGSKGNALVFVPVEFVAQQLEYTCKTDKTKGTVTLKSTTSGSSSSTDKIIKAKTSNEMRAMYISCYDFGTLAKTKAQFETKINTMFNDSAQYGMNAVVVQVRAASDAMYSSEYYPWSKYVSGTQGKSVSYDPLAIMIEAAHKRNMKIYAWIDPGKAADAADGEKDIALLSKDNVARKWAESTDKNRNVLFYENAYYFNPSIPEVQDLIVNGVEEIIQKYKVDGIQMDDSFYPEFDKNQVNTAFDVTEYKAYKNANKGADRILSISDWRRQNVNTLVKRIYDSVKEKSADLRFGMSVNGSLSNLRSDRMCYLDIDSWTRDGGYVDYIVPRLYYSFTGDTVYDNALNSLIALNGAGLIDVYCGIPVYKADGSTAGWQGGTILADQIKYARNTNKTKGFMFSRYAYFSKNETKTEVTNLLTLLK